MLKKNFLVMTLLLLLISPTLSSEIDDLKKKNDEYARTIAELKFENMELKFDKWKNSTIIDTKDMIIKEKNEELFWTRLTVVVIASAIVIREVR